MPYCRRGMCIIYRIAMFKMLGNNINHFNENNENEKTQYFFNVATGNLWRITFNKNVL